MTHDGAGPKKKKNGLLMNEKGKVTEVGELRNDEFWDIQKQFYGGG